MNKIEKMIKEMCPNGVEFKKLCEVFTIKNGYTPSKSNVDFWNNGTIPWFRLEDIRKNGRILNSAIQNITSKAVKGNLFPKDSIILSTTATLGEHALIQVPFICNQQLTILSLKEQYQQFFDIKFVYHYFFLLSTQVKLCANVGGGLPIASIKKISELTIPVPLLDIQNEIVKILDTFTELKAELEAELEERNKQYEYYRKSMIYDSSSCKMKPLKELAEVKRGVRVVKKQLLEQGDIPVFQNSLTPLGFFDKSNYNSDTTFIISAGAAGSIGYSNCDFWAADDCYVLKIKSELNSKYLYYCLLCQQKFINSNVRRGSIPRIGREIIENIKIPYVSLSVQNSIVEILDNYDFLCNDLNFGLPAEIEYRKEQYEYYRNKLLSFDEMKV